MLILISKVLQDVSKARLRTLADIITGCRKSSRALLSLVYIPDHHQSSMLIEFQASWAIGVFIQVSLGLDTKKATTHPTHVNQKWSIKNYLLQMRSHVSLWLNTV